MNDNKWNTLIKPEKILRKKKWDPSRAEIQLATAKFLINGGVIRREKKQIIKGYYE